MLVLQRKVGERIRLRVNGVVVWVTVTGIDRNKVKLGFDGEAEISREEVVSKYDAVNANGKGN